MVVCLSLCLWLCFCVCVCAFEFVVAFVVVCLRLRACGCVCGCVFVIVFVLSKNVCLGLWLCLRLCVWVCGCVCRCVCDYVLVDVFALCLRLCVCDCVCGCVCCCLFVFVDVCVVVVRVWLRLIVCYLLCFGVELAIVCWLRPGKCAGELAVEVRRGTLPSCTCDGGLAGNTAILHLRLRWGGGGRGGGADIKSNNPYLTGGRKKTNASKTHAEKLVWRAQRNSKASVCWLMGPKRHGGGSNQAGSRRIPKCGEKNNLSFQHFSGKTSRTQKQIASLLRSLGCIVYCPYRPFSQI